MNYVLILIILIIFIIIVCIICILIKNPQITGGYQQCTGDKAIETEYYIC